MPPGVSIGRAPVAGLALADHALSRTHAVVDVGPSGVSVRDAGSTNGVFVDGTLVTETTTVDAASTIVVGSSTLRLRRASGRGLPTRSPRDPDRATLDVARPRPGTCRDRLPADSR